MSEYFIGLDIGTDSVGWAVTDTEYKIQKKNGKALWGVRLFDTAETKEKCRGFRIARRRYERRTQRITWLRQAFYEEIAKVDPAFFLRLDESKYLEQDKKLAEDGAPLGKYTLFAGQGFTDKDYHRAYPTIYHLRKALMTQEGPFDVRLVYLALHHIFKHRGHFLLGDMKLEDVTFENSLKELTEYLKDEEELDFAIKDIATFEQVLSNRRMGAKAKGDELRKAAGFGKDQKREIAIVNLLAGKSVKPSELFASDAFSKEEDKAFSFKNDFESNEAALIALLEERMQLIYVVKNLYDWSLLNELRNGEQFLSDAKIKIYEQHREELKQLKALLKVNPKIYKEMFYAAKKELNNYSAYSGHGAKNYHCQYEDFRKYVKAQIRAIYNELNEEQKKIADEIVRNLEAETFLKKQTDKDNGVIPHQLHEQELALIVERASEYLPFLNEKDSSNLTLAERILEMFRFRIPYYVGPLNLQSSYSWVKRGPEKIYPWNFEKVVDLDQSAEAFITRMTAKCSYIGECVLPKCSLLYTRFVALNMINKICVNGKPISVEMKQRIFNECLLKKERTNFKQVSDYMLSNGLIQNVDEISGIDKEFKVSMPGYVVFRRILSDERNIKMVEDIILHMTVFGDESNLLQRWLKKEYGDVLDEDDRNYIVLNRRKFSGWGKLSEGFLETKIKHADPETGELVSIMDMLWRTNDNLMELLSAKYTFAQAIDEYREQAGVDRYKMEDILEDSYASPAIKRSIYQAMRIISEIEKIMKGKPKRVFVEVTRGEGEKSGRVPEKRSWKRCMTHAKKRLSRSCGLNYRKRTKRSLDARNSISISRRWASACIAASRLICPYWTQPMTLTIFIPGRE